MRRLLPLLLLPLAHSVSLAQAPQVWTGLCTLNGRTVYHERMAGAPGPAKEQELKAKHPRAVCMFLAPEAASNELPGLGAVAGNLAAPPGTPGDIGAALRVLKGERLPISSAPAPQAPVSVPRPPVLGTAPSLGLGVLIDDRDDPAASPPPPRPSEPVPDETAPGRIRLAAYATLDSRDVLADWQRMIAEQPAFRAYTPILSQVGTSTVLAVEGIPEDERAGLCLLAAKVGHACSGVGRRDLSPAVDSLSRSYPANFYLPEPPLLSSRVPEIEQGACDGREGRAVGLSCQATVFAAPAGVDFLAPAQVPAAAPIPPPRPASVGPQRKPGPARLSSKSAPRSNSSIANATAISTRIDSSLSR